MSYKAIYTAERQSTGRARQLNFGRTIRIVLQKPFGQTIKDCLGRRHSARQYSLSCKHPFGQTIDDCLGTRHSARQSIVLLESMSRSDNQLSCWNHHHSVRQNRLSCFSCTATWLDNWDCLSGGFNKWKTFICLGRWTPFGKTISDCLAEMV